jgi:hypothetical protein
MAPSLRIVPVMPASLARWPLFAQRAPVHKLRAALLNAGGGKLRVMSAAVDLGAGVDQHMSPGFSSALFSV